MRHRAIRHPCPVTGLPLRLEESLLTCTTVSKYPTDGPFIVLIVKLVDLRFQPSGEQAVIVGLVYTQQRCVEDVVYPSALQTGREIHSEGAIPEIPHDTIRADELRG